MGADDELQAVIVQEGLGHVRPELQRPRAPLSFMAAWVWTGVIPHRLGEHLACRIRGGQFDLGPGQVTEVRKPHIDLFKQPAMNDKDLLVDHRGNWEVAPELLEELVEVYVAVLPPNLVDEPVGDVALDPLVVAAIQMHTVGVEQLECQKDGRDLHSVFPTVHEIAVEQVLRPPRLGAPTLHEDGDQVRQLPVQVPHDDQLLVAMALGLKLRQSGQPLEHPRTPLQQLHKEGLVQRDVGLVDKGLHQLVDLLLHQREGQHGPCVHVRWTLHLLTVRSRRLPLRPLRRE
mmetsp:Transcript_142790/g.249037  ORF Transcript_142790/g.249037 Transcript_142790/m.249037 type:complete len:288 (-) Transcript_142790:286-1149(-)